MTLLDYLRRHAQRGPCMCGKCCDNIPGPSLEGHTVDMIFFRVSAVNDPKADEMKALIAAHQSDYEPVNPLDGEEHGYVELGAWLGDQGYAMMFMALGQILGLWKILSPYTMLGKDIPESMAMQLAGAGYITIKADRDENPVHPTQQTTV